MQIAAKCGRACGRIWATRQLWGTEYQHHSGSHPARLHTCQSWWPPGGRRKVSQHDHCPRRLQAAGPALLCIRKVSHQRLSCHKNDPHSDHKGLRMTCMYPSDPVGFEFCLRLCKPKQSLAHNFINYLPSRLKPVKGRMELQDCPSSLNVCRRDEAGQVYYSLEYKVTRPGNFSRHNISTYAARYLFTHFIEFVSIAEVWAKPGGSM